MSTTTLTVGLFLIICLLCLLLVVGVWRAVETRLHRQCLGLFAEALDAYTRETLERLDWLRAQTPLAASPWPSRPMARLTGRRSIANVDA